MSETDEYVFCSICKQERHPDDESCPVLVDLLVASADVGTTITVFNGEVVITATA